MREQRRGKNACHASDASIEQSRWDAIVPIRRLFIGPPNPENRSCIVGPPNELQTTRQVLLGKPIEHRQRATLEKIHGTGKAPRVAVWSTRSSGMAGVPTVGVAKTSKASRGRGELGFDAAPARPGHRDTGAPTPASQPECAGTRPRPTAAPSGHRGALSM